MSYECFYKHEHIPGCAKYPGSLVESEHDIWDKYDHRNHNMKDIGMSIIDEGKKRHKELVRQKAQAEEADRTREIREREAKREKWAKEAIALLQQMNREVFEHLNVNDWKWDGEDYLFYQLPVGRIYYYYSRDINSEAGYLSPGLYYFRDWMGLGGERFFNWDQLATLIGKHAIKQPTI